jgi:hypothetical protein
MRLDSVESCGRKVLAVERINLQQKVGLKIDQKPQTQAGCASEVLESLAVQQ